MGRGRGAFERGGTVKFADGLVGSCPDGPDVFCAHSLLIKYISSERISIIVTSDQIEFENAVLY